MSHHNLIMRPSAPTSSIPQIMDQYLSNLSATNDHQPQCTVIHTETDISTCISMSTSTSMNSESSSESSTCNTTFHTDSNSDITTLSVVSDTQLKHHIPLNNNETIIRRLHNCQQITIFNNTFIALPEETDEENSSESNKNYK